MVVSAGNIDRDEIGGYLDIGQLYPDYINNKVVFFPADCRNVLTVGSYTLCASNFVPKDYPSPFSKAGFSESILKPEVMAPGGNYYRYLNGSLNKVN